MESIEQSLPHRAPFLFVDAVVSRTADEIETSWRVDPDWDVLRGHYPGQPVVPGVLICEHAIQSGALLLSREPAGEADGGIPVLTHIEQARFRRPVLPGDTLTTRVRRVESIAGARRMEATVRCAGERVATLSYIVTRAEVPRARA